MFFNLKFFKYRLRQNARNSIKKLPKILKKNQILKFTKENKYFVNY